MASLSDLATKLYELREKKTELNNQVKDVQSELDDTQTGAGLDTDGSYIQPSGSNYIDTAVSLADADSKLDAQIKTNADNISQNASDISDNAAAISALQTDWSERVFGEVYAPATNETQYTVANFPIKAGTLRVYFNGIRQRLGASFDYTVNEVTGVITMNDTIKANKDYLQVDYEY